MIAGCALHCILYCTAYFALHTLHCILCTALHCIAGHCRMQWCIEGSSDMIERAMICAAPICSCSQSNCRQVALPLSPPLPPSDGVLGRSQPRCLLDARESRPRWPWVLHSAAARCTTAAEAAAAAQLHPELQRLFFTHHHHQFTAAKSLCSQCIISDDFAGSACPS